jgi:hypothetical protein
MSHTEKDRKATILTLPVLIRCNANGRKIMGSRYRTSMSWYAGNSKKTEEGDGG